MTLIDVRELEEFGFVFGDPRPHFFRYLEKTGSNMVSCLPPSKKYTVTSPFVLKCGENGKRSFRAPKNLEKIKKVIEKTDKPIVLIPILLVNKLVCKSKNRSRHMCIYVLNKVRNTIERVDIKRYHLVEFNLKLVYARFEQVLQHLGYDEDTAPTLVNEIDINMTFQKKHGFDRADKAYPPFLLSYLKTMNDNPTLPQNKLVTLVNKMSSKQVKSTWDTYVQFRKEHDSNPCPQPDMVRNQEIGRCMTPQSKTYMSLLKNKPPKPCKANQVYSNILDKCVLPKKNIDIDILAASVMSTKYNPSQQLTHTDGTALINAQIILFLAHKYQYAKFILPAMDSYKHLEKKEFKVRWAVTKEGASLHLPEGYWDMFKQHILDPSCRFIISILSLTVWDGSSHANCLIYDKSTNEFERFDPLTVNIHQRYRVDDLDKELKEVIASKATDIFSKPPKYYEPLKYCPKSRVFQSMEVSEIPGVDLKGNCAVWNWWYINVRIANPSVTRKDIIDIASKKLEKMGGLYKFIKSYQKYVVNSAKALYKAPKA